MKRLLKATFFAAMAFTGNIATAQESDCDNFINFDANRVKALVSGDFDRDGDEDDVLACYDHGANNTTFYVWRSNGTKMKFDWSWYSSNQFNANNIKGKFVSGDFNGDGKKDDIAAIYDYGGGHAKAHVWFSSGSAMIYQGIWWQNSGNFPFPNKFSGRVVSGDFDNDDKHDDIAFYYDDLYGKTHIRTLLGNTTTFAGSIPVWYSGGPGTFDANKATDRIISGDFDNDGYHDDILACYDHGGNKTTIYKWRSNGNYLIYDWGWFTSNAYNANLIKGRVVSADFDSDGKQDDLASFYDYGNSEMGVHYWRSNGTSLSGAWTTYNSGPGMFNANGITNRVVSGDFDKDGKNDDVLTMYNYTTSITKLFMWKNISTQRTAYYQTVWASCPPKRRGKTDATTSITEKNEAIGINTLKVYPNPTKGIFHLEYTADENATVKVYDYTGKEVKHAFLKNHSTQIDLSNEPKGIYVVEVITTEGRVSKKLILQ